MSYLFFIDQKNKKVLHPDVVRLKPELALLSDKEILFIILAYDYNSIYRQFPERQRLSKAIWHVFEDNVPNLLDEDKRPQRIKSAIEAYKGLQYNRNIELIELYNRKLDEQMELLVEEKSSSGTKNISDNIDRFKKAIRSIELEVIEEKLMDGELKGATRLSFLDKMQQNDKMYFAITAKRG